MMVVSEMTTSILNRILLVNAKARQGFADINSPYVVIDGKEIVNFVSVDYASTFTLCVGVT